MITFEVGDLDAYWSEVAAKWLAADRFSWGGELHIIDPGGVCWHVRQAKAS